MKQYQSFGFLASIVFAVGMVGFNLSDGTFGTNQEDASSMGSGVGFVGHIEAIHRDSEGNILSYQQTDNAITNKGINCVLTKMFIGAYGATTCPADPGTYDTIGLVNGTGVDGLDLNINSTGALLYVDGSNGLAPSSTIGASFNDLAAGTARTTEAEMGISSLFTSTGDAHTVAGATLQNGTANQGIFAFKDFASSVILNDGDSLTVNWQIGMTGTAATAET